MQLTSRSCTAPVAFWAIHPGRVRPSVASVRVRTRRGEGAGSASVLTSDGFLLTSAHVVEHASRIRLDFTNGTGQEQWGQATSYAPDGPPVEKRPARLELVHKTGMRRDVEMTSKSLFRYNLMGVEYHRGEPLKVNLCFFMRPFTVTVFGLLVVLALLAHLCDRSLVAPTSHAAVDALTRFPRFRFLHNSSPRVTRTLAASQTLSRRGISATTSLMS